MAIEIKVPEMGESVTEATISAWTKKEGDAVKVDEVLAILETDKVSLEIPAPTSGVLKSITKKVGDVVHVRDIMGTIEEGAVAAAPASSGGAAPKAETPSAQPNTGKVNEGLPPAARKLIEENKLDISKITGTGRNGQITKEDVILFMEKGGASSASAPKAATSPEIPKAVVVSANAGPRETVVPMTKLRQTIANRLVNAQHTAAILTTFNEVDMSPIMELRNKYKDKFKETHGVGLGFMSLFTKAAVAALKAFPAINAEIRGTDIVYKNYYDIGVAVGGPKGLVVPIVRNADLLSFAGVEQEIARLAGKVKDGKISLEDMEGGTFSISNGGVYGSMMSTPILNPPQSGILGMHNIVKRAVVVNDQIVIRPMMYLALSYDHRIVDGKEAVQFLVKIKEMVEDPTRLLFEV
ncbi:2-oxoglutarate dehydrogenase complex dihydrolipoyllysine-residue succinyltransferase [Leptospira sp. 2 VSF19]|uniref:Dihydrolipoyllysine-residue succinyltransferase component of 2-oxoglutarate dehydrogenase complex n=1 Tax=Leptospira soteropolitanensis TaxID=2950025 RepID=A0AAW5VI69_9LEPT|nr:2-oxoglutarate dehydrogenase complex dihydrolipoyllysine-residue succinyltransferase [Leptospira soteropolitanensis]MCW7493822.1 2-oxoglutarate dehydrogenase complex dihydrolipoyllysine-residue succinyltransferase [Leptospira soteropolitanensis]MCW7501417.1 2-oxoglutarate dehydrogenase complex dihydrolipoyllysine-residue succinyltransferase [Leptospira soteropolitanensis]MCW7523820.1 2-oxoglutarate dehydrogenase complex dihydrolipoyllysine-residue succinyltransferase [Leptospira soteropolitan